MPWFKIDDGFWSHPKTTQLSDGAQALWLRAGSWSMNHLTDGFIPAHVLPLLRSRKRYVDELVGVSLWLPSTDGYQFHDWDKYQPTRDQVETDRRDAAERKRKSREKSRKSHTVTPDVTDGVSHASPTRPDPTILKDTLVQPQLDEHVPEEPKSPYSKQFEEWWPHYPRRESKGDAFKAWEQTRKAKTLPPLPEMIAAADAYTHRSAQSEPRFIKLAGGWLRDRKWEDEPPPEAGDSWAAYRG